jgi:hypothetical protein
MDLARAPRRTARKKGFGYENVPKLSRIERTAFLIRLIILSDLSTMQSRLTFKGHKALAKIRLFSNTFDIHKYNFLR